MNLLNLAPNGWSPPASQTPSNNGVPAVGGFHTVRGGIVRGDDRFRPRIIGVVDARNAFCSEDGIAYSPGAGGFTNPNQQSASKVGVSTPCVAVSTRRTTVFVPGLSELYMYGRISDPGIGPYPAQVALGTGSTNPRLGFPHRSARY